MLHSHGGSLLCTAFLRPDTRPNIYFVPPEPSAGDGDTEGGSGGSGRGFPSHGDRSPLPKGDLRGGCCPAGGPHLLPHSSGAPISRALLLPPCRPPPSRGDLWGAPRAYLRASRGQGSPAALSAGWLRPRGQGDTAPSLLCWGQPRGHGHGPALPMARRCSWGQGSVLVSPRSLAASVPTPGAPALRCSRARDGKLQPQPASPCCQQDPAPRPLAVEFPLGDAHGVRGRPGGAGTLGKAFLSLSQVRPPPRFICFS